MPVDSNQRTTHHWPGRSCGFALALLTLGALMAGALDASLVMTNDGLAWDNYPEWDDGYTFGFAIDAETRSYGVGAEIRSYTKRPRERTDQAMLRAALPAVSISHPLGRSRLTFIVAGLYTGNLGLLELQERWHATADVRRPVPTEYGRSVLDGRAGLALASVSGGAPLALSTSLSATVSILGYGDLNAGVGPVYQTSRADLAALVGYRYAVGEHPHPLIQGSRESKSGLYAGSAVQVGAIRVDRVQYLASGRGTGSVGFTWRGIRRSGEPTPWREPPLLCEFGGTIGHQCYIQRTMVYPMNRRLSHHLSLHAGVGYVWASGWARESAPEIANRLGGIWLPGEAKLRISRAGLVLDLYAALGMGYLEERQLTATVAQAQPMWRGRAFSHRESVGARIGFEYRPSLVTGVALEVSFASTVRSGWPNVETTLSVYSESLP